MVKYGQEYGVSFLTHGVHAFLFLCVGADDLKICELSLDETGLTRKKAAEILENEFEQEWAKHGGNQYTQSVLQQVSSKFLQMKLGITKK